MIDRLPVSSKALRRRDVEAAGGPLRRAAVLPFFDVAGEVAFCLLVVPGQSRLGFFAPCEVGPRVPLWGPIRFGTPLISWSDGDQAPALDRLWHYDPDWLLRDDRFAGAKIVADLRRTNCAGRLPEDVRRFYFRRDLSRVRAVGRGSDDGLRLVAVSTVLPLHPDHFAPAGADGNRSTPPTGWRLDPIWMRTPHESPRG